MAGKSVANGDFYKRIGGVALMEGGPPEGQDFSTVVDYKVSEIMTDLNFRFHFDYKTTLLQGVRGNGTVGILGLNTDTIRKWASAAAAEENIKKSRAIRVYAGYEHDGALEDCELFTAQYIGALPTMPPEMWLDFTVQSGNSVLSTEVLSSQGLFLSGTFTPGAHAGTRSPYATKESYSSSSGVTIKTACEMLAKSVVVEQCGYRKEGSENKSLPAGDHISRYFMWCISPELEKRLPKLRQIDFSAKTPEQAVALINSWKVVRAEWDYYDVTFDSERFRRVPQLVVKPNFKDFKFDTSLKEPFTIDSDSGMIGLPQYGTGQKFGEVVVKCLMRRDIGVGDLIRPISRYISSPFEYYCVTEVAYDGEYRGQNWYVTYTAQQVKSDQELEKIAKEKAEKEKAEKERESAPPAPIANTDTKKMWIMPGKTANSIAFP